VLVQYANLTSSVLHLLAIPLTKQTEQQKVGPGAIHFKNLIRNSLSFLYYLKTSELQPHIPADIGYAPNTLKANLSNNKRRHCTL
jgi:hypothetical protein